MWHLPWIWEIITALLLTGVRKRGPGASDFLQSSRKDSIFGGIERLHECIEYAVKTCHPECLVIASSCVAGVIGDDVDEEAREAEETYGIPVLSMAFSGFLGGEYSDGYYKTMDAIMRRFSKAGP